MFNDNKYTTTYYSIIENAHKRNSDEGNFERHHIIPRSLGGTNDLDNLVLLTPREHYICHALLPKMVTGNAVYKMYAAFNMMHVGHNGRRYTSHLYEYYKVKFYKQHGEAQIGKQMSEESKRRMSKTRKGKPWSDRARAAIRNKPTAKRIAVVKKDDQTYIGEWESIGLCARELNCDPTQIWKMCEGKPQRPAQNGRTYPIRQHKGYIFKYVELD